MYAGNYSTRRRIESRGPTEEGGAKLRALAKRNDVNGLRAELLGQGLSTRSAPVLPAVLKEYEASGLTFASAAGAKEKKVQCDELIGTLRRCNPATATEAETIHARIDELRKEASALTRLMSAAEVAHWTRGVIESMFGWFIGSGPCRDLNGTLPQYLRAELQACGCDPDGYPWEIGEREYYAIVQAAEESPRTVQSPLTRPDSE